MLPPAKARKKVDAKTKVKKVKRKTAADDLESGSEYETPKRSVNPGTKNHSLFKNWRIFLNLTVVINI